MNDTDTSHVEASGMRMSRRRLKVRTLMIAVAIVAILLGAMVELPRLWNLRQQYLGFAAKYGYWETRLNGAVDLRQEITYYSIRLPRGPEPSPDRLARMKAEASYFAGLRAKYERAARFPWLPVEPDPPEPK
jgi:hypothetical protein